MSDKRKELLLAALQRAGKPRTSGELLDDAHGLALAEGWTPDQTADITRKSVAKHLQHMERDGLVRTVGATVDETRKPTPMFAPVDGFDLNALVPAPPMIERALTGKPSSYANLDRPQLLAVLDAQDDLLAEFARHIKDQELFFERLGKVREKCRARLIAAGLE